ncbi:MAG TPA: hypothetical protein G4O11_11665 [Anaerolineae bacterium]|nr:hypothetical protein [Anaerolineae bacterium]
MAGKNLSAKPLGATQTYIPVDPKTLTQETCSHACPEPLGSLGTYGSAEGPPTVRLRREAAW